MTIRVLLVDDHALVREGVRHILEAEDDFEIVGEAADGAEGVALTESLVPDVVLMDLTMPEMDGLEATKRIRDRQPAVRVLILTMHESYDYFFEVLRLGASGYILKGASGDELRAAVRSAANDDVYIQPSVAKRLVADYLERVGEGVRAEVAALTEREREVLQRIAAGHTSQQIADDLVLSVNTVNTHRRHVMEKLNLHSRAELIGYAVRRGLIQGQPGERGR